ncbi:uncharacterized protein AMSG_05789 [Thecamonas trahens ATCC 50062]|uniref:Uncharacterized protein n=1 Tax=Thecamonas trahens ATCC 50062 TaxID=461836 RepID=A0A0L0DCR5_THETB|nr:hypothetical protein AMSG_05789 [Thecamonas trahens ATCC 50062]KNC50030.1 hypothetical protein AMSG_05789 [Thecamonas trahens ATCC 50062]|eukprot:XP_013757197.1 hypothetical protein AMSG_05789 [Thecamonas trahens ATCC 50062]
MMSERTGDAAGDKEPTPSLWRKVLAETFGTTMLVTIGCGALASNGAGLSTLVPAWAFSGVVMAMIMSLGGISGAHLNPNVSLACVVLQTLTVVEGVAFMAAQMVGGVLGAAFLWLVLPPSTDPGMPDLAVSCTRLAPRMHGWQGMLVEAVGTCLLVTVVLVADVHRPSKRDSTLSGPQGVMLALMSIILFAGPLTGAGLNYARVFGPALISSGDCWDNHWLWPVGEALGTLLGVAVAVTIVPGLWRRVLPTKKEPAVGMTNMAYAATQA